MQKISVLIMAGGSGERFYPLSTKKHPKQYLSIFSDKPLIAKTIERVLPLTDIDHIFVATNEVQVDILKECCPELPNRNIIIEPMFKDTAAAIGYGTLIINKYFPNSIIAVLASDHLIKDENEFRKTLQIAAENAEKGYILTLGIEPSYPEIGYGYIEVDRPELNKPTSVLSFKEKPELETAKKYFKSGNFLWNSGMFIFNSNTIIDAFRKYAKKHYDILKNINKLINENTGVETSKLVSSYFDLFEKISIDYAIMEHAKNLLVIPSSFGWSDVGSYLAFDSLFGKDASGVVNLNAKYYSIDSKNNIIVSDTKDIEIDTIDVEDMIIAYSDGKLLISSKKGIKDLKKLLVQISKD